MLFTTGKNMNNILVHMSETKIICQTETFISKRTVLLYVFRPYKDVKTYHVGMD